MLEALAWWAAIFVGYLALISTVSLTELIVGGVAASLAAAAAVGARRALFEEDGAAARGTRLDAAVSLILIRQVGRDAVRLTGRVRDGFGEGRVPADRRSAGWTGLLTLVLSASPGTYVAQVAPERDRFIVHRVGEGPDRLERRLLE